MASKLIVNRSYFELISQNEETPFVNLRDVLIPNLCEGILTFSAKNVNFDLSELKSLLPNLENVKFEHVDLEKIDETFTKKIKRLDIIDCRNLKEVVFNKESKIEYLCLRDTKLGCIKNLEKTSCISFKANTIFLNPDPDPEEAEFIKLPQTIETLLLYKQGLSKIPDFVSKLTNLRFLALSCNNITEMTPLFELTKLEELVMTENRIKELKYANKDVKKIYTSDNMITDVKE